MFKNKNCIYLHDHLCDLSKIFCSMLFTFLFWSSNQFTYFGCGLFNCTGLNHCNLLKQLQTYSWQLLEATVNKQDVWWCNALTERESCYKHTQRAVSRRLECILYTCQKYIYKLKKKCDCKNSFIYFKLKSNHNNCCKTNNNSYTKHENCYIW